MLEVKNLKKIYKTKGGAEVKALDDVSIIFPKSGMIFLLGKSGSGKSTLLNVIGGLDRPDDGEIIIKGKNSKDFSGSDFDSYRNTFIGFIFQEYNILNEFNVDQNIGLALELQGKKNDKKEINKILENVDLDGMGKRKPNTLSGGQKQRVAIARALVKNPEIIMADEPTGALDSNTGKQVFDTLKKLSKEKLVIVVSHDRDFAEIYADRIIELADGKIISDMIKEHIEPKSINSNINIINDNVLSIKDVEQLNKNDMDEIYNILKNKKGEILITSDDKNISNLKQSMHISQDNKSEIFIDNNDEIKPDVFDSKNTKFIKSHLPLSKSIRIGASSLKTKPIRMIFTIFLTIVALVMFGVTSTLMLYNESYSIAEALKNSTLDYEQIQKEYKYDSISHNVNLSTMEDSITNSYASSSSTTFYESDINNLNSKSNNKYAGVIKFGRHEYYSNPSVILGIQTLSSRKNVLYYPFSGLTGFIDAGEDYLNSNKFRIIAGNYPTKYDEIAISKYMFDMMMDSSDSIKNYYDVIGSDFNTTLNAKGNNNYIFKISGIIDCGNIPSKYDELLNSSSKLNQKELNDLGVEFKSYIGNSFHQLGYVSNDFYSYYEKDNQIINTSDNYITSIWVDGLNIGEYNNTIYTDPTKSSIQYFSPSIIKIMNNKNLKYKDLDDNYIEFVEPKENEIYIPLSHKRMTELNMVALMFNQNLTSEIANIDEDKRNEIYINLEKYNVNENYYIENIKPILNLYKDYIKYYNVLDMANAYLNQIRYDNINYNEDPNYIYISNNYDQMNIEIANRTYNYDEYYNNLANFLTTSVNVNHYYLTLAAKDIMNYNIEFEGKDILNNILNKADLNIDDYNEIKRILDLNKFIYKTNDINYDPYMNNYYYKSFNGSYDKLNVIGYFDFGFGNVFILNDEFIKKYGTNDTTNVWYNETKTNYEFKNELKYDNLIVKTAFTENEINLMLSNYDSYKFLLTNQTYQMISYFISMINTLKQIFLIIGIVFAAFAALMLFNFISTSISSKIKEIGILRALGARGLDLFKIFFSESAIISIICVILSIGISIIVCNLLNNNLAQNVNVVLLKFGIINIGLIIAGAIIIAFIGTFIPVFIASKKQPVESIRTL